MLCSPRGGVDILIGSLAFMEFLFSVSGCWASYLITISTRFIT